MGAADRFVAGVELIIIAIITAVPATIAAVAALRGSSQGKRNSHKIDALHEEVRSPSNGVSNGGYTETIGMCLPWLVESLMDLYAKLEIEPRRPPPNVISPQRHPHEEY